jgi:hypothetical protein
MNDWSVAIGGRRFNANPPTTERIVLDKSTGVSIRHTVGRHNSMRR